MILQVYTKYIYCFGEGGGQAPGGGRLGWVAGDITGHSTCVL